MFLFFDTETTGLPRRRDAPVSDLSNWPRVVQLGWALYSQDGRRLDAEAYLIKPVGFSIPADATRVHGITTARAVRDGVGLEQALESFGHAVPKATCIVAHNLAFDEPILHAEYSRVKLSFPLGDQQRYCTMALSTAFCALPGAYGPKWPRLSELHQRLFGRPHDEAHDARADIDACAKCFFELVRIKVIRL